MTKDGVRGAWGLDRENDAAMLQAKKLHFQACEEARAVSEPFAFGTHSACAAAVDVALFLLTACLTCPACSLSSPALRLVVICFNLFLNSSLVSFALALLVNLDCTRAITNPRSVATMFDVCI